MEIISYRGYRVKLRQSLKPEQWRRFIKPLRISSDGRAKHEVSNCAFNEAKLLIITGSLLIESLRLEAKERYQDKESVLYKWAIRELGKAT